MLTERKKQFCDHYLICLNQTEAAKKAGYKSKRPEGVKQKAYRLMQEKEVREYINERLEQKKEGLVVKQDQVLQYLSGCVLGTEKEKQHFILKNGEKGSFNDQLIERDVDLKARDRIRAAEIMVKIYKLMDQGIDNEEEKGVIINNDIPKVNNE